jgi:hypothetical protein
MWKKIASKTFAGVGALLAVASAGMWVVAAQAQLFAVDPRQTPVASVWNGNSAQFNYLAALLTAVATACTAIAVALDD